MSEKDLRKLHRSELLEIMLEQQSEIDRLREEVAELKNQVEKRQLLLTEAGSIAEASLRLSGVFEAAQRAADLYLQGIRDSVEAGEIGV